MTYQIRWTICEVRAAGDGRLVDVHGVRVLEARVAGGLQVDDYEVVLQ